MQEPRPTVEDGEIWITQSLMRTVIRVAHVRRSRGGFRGLRWMVLVRNADPGGIGHTWDEWLTGAEFSRWCRKGANRASPTRATAICNTASAGQSLLVESNGDTSPGDGVDNGPAE